MTRWLLMHPLLTYVIIYIFLAYIYNKVFRVRKLPILKDAVIYLLLGVGTFILWLFQLTIQLPIVYSLGTAILLILIVRTRYLLIRHSQKKG